MGSETSERECDRDVSSHNYLGRDTRMAGGIVASGHRTRLSDILTSSAARIEGSKVSAHSSFDQVHA